MSRFDSLMRDLGAPAILEHAGRSIVYRQPNADDVTLTAVVRSRGDDEQDGITDGDRERVRRCSITIRTDAAAAEGGVAEPRLGDLVVIDEETWRVESVAGMPGPLATLELIRISTLAAQRRGYREKGTRR